MQHQTHAHSEILDRLERFGPSVSTYVVVNGRRLLVNAAMTLILSLPAHSRVWLEHRALSIEPDPFAPPATGATTDGADLVAELLKRQKAADRPRHWWQRLGRHTSQ